MTIALVAPLTVEAIYREHFRFVWRSLARLGVPDGDLADAAQDVFVVVHRKLSDFDYQHRLTTWLYAICMRVASERRRSARSRYEVLSEQLPEVARAHELGDGAQVRATHHRLLLEQALEALPIEQRAVFTLFELEGLSASAIAELVDAPLATVHSRLRLARQTVRRVLERERARDGFDDVARGGRS